MTEFKVGDRVRVTSNTRKNQQFIGEVGTVTTSPYAHYDEVTVSFDGDSDKFYFAPSDLKLVEDEPEVQVGDKVRVTKVYEFEVDRVTEKSVRGRYPLQGHYYEYGNPAYTIEVIERAKFWFEVGQVLTEIEEVEALPMRSRISMVDPESGSGNLWTRTEKGVRGITGREYSVESLGVVTQFDIRVVWLP